MKLISRFQPSRPAPLAVTLSAAFALAVLNNSCNPVSEEIPSENSSPTQSEPVEATEPAEETPSAPESPKPAETPESAAAPDTPEGAATETSESAATETTEEAKPDSGAASQKESQAATPGAQALATFGNGCFWCTEAVMERLEGVSAAVSGYMGGHVENPTYEQVCTKTTGHAEVVQVTYDPSKVTFEELLDIFWHSHDPTTKDRQGNDVGPQYRSVIFYHNEAQKLAAENSMAKENASGKFGAPIVTEITEAAKFWEAEADHQDFFARNPDNYYCRMTIPAKLRKLGLE